MASIFKTLTLPHPRVLTAIRTPLRDISARRFLRGGRVRDLGRLPRYAGFVVLGVSAIWVPILGYLAGAPESYRSHMSLILPGSGASASVNLESIGQASSFANSAFSSSTISPTETYKRLLSADRIVAAAARQVGIAPGDFGAPRVELVDQTGFIHVALSAPSPEAARDRLSALRVAFFREIEALRSDEIVTREQGAGAAIEEYRASVQATRAEITRLQRDTGLVSPEQFQSLVAEADALSRHVLELTAALDDATAAVRALEGALGLTPTLAAAALKLHADSEFAALAEEMSSRAADLSQARGAFGASHPNVQGARAGYDAARRAATARALWLTQLTAEDLARLDLSHVGDRAGLLSDLVRQEARRAGLAEELSAVNTQRDAAETRRAALLAPATRLEDLQRDFAVAEAVFASAMARTQSSKTDLFASYPLVQVLEDPTLPETPSSPRRKLAFAAGAAGTLFLLVGLALAWLRRPLVDRLLAPRPETRPEPVAP